MPPSYAAASPLLAMQPQGSPLDTRASMRAAANPRPTQCAIPGCVLHTVHVETIGWLPPLLEFSILEGYTKVLSNPNSIQFPFLLSRLGLSLPSPRNFFAYLKFEVPTKKLALSNLKFRFLDLQKGPGSLD